MKVTITYAQGGKIKVEISYEDYAEIVKLRTTDVGGRVVGIEIIPAM